MGKAKISILDYGACNLFNITRAFEHIGEIVETVDTPEAALQANRLVVPGVGAFHNCMHEITARGYSDAIVAFVSTGRPFLGICVGMQILFDGSEEFGDHPGLGLLRGKVCAIPSITADGANQKVPHIGWNHLHQERDSWQGSILETLENTNPAVYFVHSFAARPSQESITLASCNYGGHKICAAIQHENISATQFHPERSGPVGLEILRQFCNN